MFAAAPQWTLAHLARRCIQDFEAFMFVITLIVRTRKMDTQSLEGASSEIATAERACCEDCVASVNRFDVRSELVGSSECPWHLFVEASFCAAHE